MTMRSFFLVALSLLPLAAWQAAHAQMIEGPAVAQIEALGGDFVALLNEPEADARQAMYATVFNPAMLTSGSVERLDQAFAFMHQAFAPLDFHHAELIQWTTPSGIKRILHTFARDRRHDQWKNFQLRIDEGPEYRIASIGFVADVSEPVYLPAGGIRSEREWLDGYVTQLIEEEDLFGSVLVVERDEVLYERHFGYEDAARTRPITAETRFNMASGTKMFTAVAVAQLVEAGHLDWQTPVSQYVEGLPDDIHVHHLLTHTSGVAEFWTEATEARMAAATDPQRDYLNLVLEAGTDFAPGTAASYSNSNYILAGAVIEAVSGQRYADYVQAQILDPAGMTHTFVTPPADDVPMAAPLTGGRHAWVEVLFTPRPTSAGGAFTTARDMHAFARALADGTLLSPEVLDVVTTSKTADVPNARRDSGYGFILDTQQETTFAGHGGIANGVNFGFDLVRARDLTFVIFSNQDNGAYDDLKKNIKKLISGYR